MQNFTPYTALLGGCLIGLSALILMLFNGRIAGISGILGGMLARHSPDRGWRIAFICGLIMAPMIFKLLGVQPVTPEVPGSATLWIGAGLLVGYGTKISKGCTSGHGVCGLARLSPRSMVATLIFMTVAGVTVYIQRYFF